MIYSEITLKIRMSKYNNQCDDYFDQEEKAARNRNKGDNMAFMRSSNLLQNQGNSKKDEDSEEDPLDAFMKEINVQAK